MKRPVFIGLLMLLALAACHSPQRQARQMVRLAERLFDTMPDSTASLIDSVLRMPVYFGEKQRMDMALLQGEALFGDRGRDLSPLMDDEFFDDKERLTTSPELERAAAYYARKKQYDKAAHAALYSGFVQQHYGEKAAAMQSFKEAEHYGELAGDSLAVARAEHKMGQLLYNDYMENEALSMFTLAERGFGSHYEERALTRSRMATCYIVQGDYTNAETCLHQSLLYEKKKPLDKVKHKVLNNYAVLYRLQGQYDKSISYLRQISCEPNLNDTELVLLYLNTGIVFLECNKLDSATYYYHLLDSFLPDANIKNETKVSAYGALARFAESQNDVSSALQYRKQYETFLNEVRDDTEQRIVYGIQKKYDHEALQSTMSQRIIRRQRIIICISIVSVLGLVALAVSRIRLAKIRKQEAEAKANLFHFMQQNKELQQKHESSERAILDLSKVHESDKKAYQDLMQKYNDTKGACLDYAQQLSNTLNKEALIMRKLGIYMENTGEKAYLVALKDAVFDGKDRWEALMRVFDTLYPDVRSNLAQQYPELTEMEQKDFILSYFNVSREDEALLFKKSVHLVDKWRNGVRKKMQAREEKHDK